MESSGYRDGFMTTAPALAFMAIVLMLGLYIPGPLTDMLESAVRFLGNQA
jgi:hypothetical protein